VKDALQEKGACLILPQEEVLWMIEKKDIFLLVLIVCCVYVCVIVWYAISNSSFLCPPLA